ncbi:MAG: hypothetical protein AAGB19_16610 [Cyanobacteria bacterium P01_F01_bin.3]
MPVIFDQVIGKVDAPLPPPPPEQTEEKPPPAAAVRQQIVRTMKLKAERQERLSAD